MSESTLDPHPTAPGRTPGELFRRMIHHRRLARLILSGLLLAAPGLARCVDAAQPDAGAPAAPATPASARTEETNSQEILRAWLQLQEQLHTTQLAIEQNRLAADRAADESARVLGSRLDGIEKALANQRTRELETLQNSNRMMVIAAAAFGGVGCLAMLLMLLMVWFQWRAVHRLAGITAALPMGHAFAGGPPPVTPPAVEAALLGAGPAIESNRRLLGALEQLEKRILELEHTTTVSLPHPSGETGATNEATPSEANGNGQTAPASVPANGSSGESAANRITRLLKGGQSLLGADQPEDAIRCFDAVLAVDPKHGEALVKKGAALEKLRKLDEAIDHYNKAIEADASLTIAYLHKGGLFNRMERFNEALECYELALRTQERHARQISTAQASAA